MIMSERQNSIKSMAYEAVKKRMNNKTAIDYTESLVCDDKHYFDGMALNGFDTYIMNHIWWRLGFSLFFGDIQLEMSQLIGSNSLVVGEGGGGGGGRAEWEWNREKESPVRFRLERMRTNERKRVKYWTVWTQWL